MLLSGWLCPAQAQTTNGEIPLLIEKLSNDDPKVRDDATRRLRELSRDAREALTEAVKSPDPETSERAAAILGDMPWYLPTDPQPVPQILHNYGKLDVPQRRAAIGGLGDIPGEIARDDALIRLLHEEISDEVRWTIVEVLRRDVSERHLQRLRALSTDNASAPMLAAIGWAWWPKDRDLALRLYEKAVAGDARQPAEDHGAIGFVFAALADRAIEAKDYDGAAAIIRRQAAREPADAGGLAVPQPVLALFSLHGELGPLKGFEQDIRTYAAHLPKAPVLYALSTMYWRQGGIGQAMALREAAFLSGLTSQQLRFDTTDYLLAHHLDALAERELHAVLTLAGEDDTVTAVNARFRLANIAARRGDDFACAEEMRKGIETLPLEQRGMLRLGQAGRQPRGVDAEQAIWGQINWHYLRAAKAKNDAAGITKYLDELMKLPNPEPDVTMEVVALLKEQGRHADAMDFFGRTYDAQKQALDTDPTNSELMNNLAWLCVICDEKLNEALKLATAAVESQPDNSAYLDTAASANYLLGHKEQAVRLETKALAGRPTDAFMREQLERFKAGKPMKKP